VRLPRAWIVAFSVALAAPALALDTPNERITLVGLTGVHAFTGSSDEGAAQFVTLQRLRDRGELAIRVTATVPDVLVDAAADAGLRTGVGDAMLLVGALKIFADGTLGSQTASMIEPFAGQLGNVGIRVRTPEEIDGFVRRANDGGLWCAVHAIGDRANRDVLDIFERHLDASRRARVSLS